MRRIIRWAPAMIWMSVIFYFSHQPGDKLETFLPLFHWLLPAMKSFNWGHFVEYFTLAVAISWGLGLRFTAISGKLLVVVLCFLYGLTDEYHQGFVAGRSPDPLDLRNDTIGAALAVFILSVPPFKRLFRKHLSTK